ncbi:MAG: LON peptidase substrate-binding domain-containing protein [Acidimicrobiales bacterium]
MAELVMPMFPLGSTVFPGQLVPLHVFEERYRALIEHVTSDGTDPVFGTVLIDRGHEVGGGDHRVSVGCTLRVMESQRFDDGRWAVATVGEERIEVVEWLGEEPYPEAMVRPIVREDTGGSLDGVQSLLDDLMAIAVERSGQEVPDEWGFSNDPSTKLDQMAALAPIATIDRQRVLEARNTADQIVRLEKGLTDRLELLRLDLGQS